MSGSSPFQKVGAPSPLRARNPLKLEFAWAAASEFCARAFQTA